MEKISKPLSWDELADVYDKATGSCARIKPMHEIFAWAEKRHHEFYVDPEEGTLHRILK